MFFKKKKVDVFVTRGNTNIYDATDVAVYIINYCAEQNRPVNNIYLQKLLYLVYSFFLVETTEKKHLFQSKMVAWHYGPAFPEVYYAFHNYENAKIPYLNKYNTIMSMSPKTYRQATIAEKDRELIRYIVDKYRDKSFGDIVFLTQTQDPWSKTYGFNNVDGIISDKMIIEYFSTHKQR